MIFMKMTKAIKFKNIIFIPLLGMMLGKVVNSITTFFAYKYDLIQNLSSWMEGWSIYDNERKLRIVIFKYPGSL